MNVVSFALWGRNPLYLEGAKINVLLAREIYPGWSVRVCCHCHIPTDLIAQLENLGADCRVVDTYEKAWHGRFDPAGDPDVDVMLSRDADSRLNWRERAAVDDWLNSGEPFHVMRDHPWGHRTRIMGGMWGVRDSHLLQMNDLTSHWEWTGVWGNDQQFLRKFIWPLIATRHVAHDEYTTISGSNTRPFPTHRSIAPLKFVGEVVNWSPASKSVDLGDLSPGDPSSPEFFRGGSSTISVTTFTCPSHAKT